MISTVVSIAVDWHAINHVYSFLPLFLDGILSVQFWALDIFRDNPDWLASLIVSTDERILQNEEDIRKAIGDTPGLFLTSKISPYEVYCQLYFQWHQCKEPSNIHNFSK